MDESLLVGYKTHRTGETTVPYTIYQRINNVDKLVGTGHLNRIGGNCIDLGDLLTRAVRGRLVLYYQDLPEVGNQTTIEKLDPSLHKE